MELRLREVNATMGLPYWDWTMENRLPDPRDSILWTDDFLGEIKNTHFVDSGPFANWTTNFARKHGSRKAIERVGQPTSHLLYSDDQIANLLEISDFDQFADQWVFPS